MAERFTANDISFQEMSEEDAVKTFQEDGYFDYQKRRMRFRTLSPDSIWATSPARMFVAFFENRPVGVVGFSQYKGALLGAGVHTRKDFRGRGLLDILIDKAIQEKGSKTLYINIANSGIIDKYRGKGFKDMNVEELPEEVQSEIEGLTFSDQVQKWIHHTSEWKSILKKVSDYERAIAQQHAPREMERGKARYIIAYQMAYNKNDKRVPSKEQIREEMENVTETQIVRFLTTKFKKDVKYKLHELIMFPELIGGDE